MTQAGSGFPAAVARQAAIVLSGPSLSIKFQKGFLLFFISAEKPLGLDFSGLAGGDLARVLDCFWLKKAAKNDEPKEGIAWPAPKSSRSISKTK
jgi:hypothetical protein